MKRSLFAFTLGCYFLVFLGLGVTLFIFNRPIFSFYEFSKKNPFFGKFSQEMTSDLIEKRSLHALLQSYHEISKLPDFCLGKIRFAFQKEIQHHFLLGPLRILRIQSPFEIDFRNYLWKIRANRINRDKCPYVENDFKNDFFKKDLIQANKVYYQKTFEKLGALFSSEPVLAEIELINDDTSSITLLLTLGIINGSSMVLLNQKVLSYFPEKIESGRLIPLLLKPKSKNTLSVLFYGKGLRGPGVAHSRFIGLIEHDSKRTDLFENNYVRNAKILMTVSAAVFFSLILLLLGLYQRTQYFWPISLSVIILSYALSEALKLDHVQSTLDGNWIRTLRGSAFLVFTFFTFAIVIELLNSLDQTFKIIKRFLGFKTISSNPVEISRARKIFSKIPLGYLVGILSFIGVLAIIALYYFPKTLVVQPLTFIAQYDMLKPVLSFSLVFGIFMVIASVTLYLLKSRLTEEAEAFAICKSAKTFLAGGLSFILYVTTYQDFLTKWLHQANVPTVSMLIEAQLLPLTIAVAILVLMAQILREQKIYERILPDSTKEMAAQATLDPISLDQTDTEYNWILLNDISNSSTLKLSNLAIVTHILQSVFHKIHKDYFQNMIHFINSLGDAMIVAIKTPFGAQKNDPILEKLVRCYSLHIDGVKLLEDSYKTILSWLKLEKKELYLAIEKQTRSNKENQITMNEFHFRTILTSDFYFYGLNHELPNIDSKSIYLVSKAEKLISGSYDGGFIIFPDLMEILEAAFGKLSRFFEEAKIDKEKSSQTLKKFLPEFAYILRKESTLEFEMFLEKKYGSSLFLRHSPQTGESYLEVRDEVKAFTDDLLKSLSLNDLVEKVASSKMTFINFFEKNLFLQTVADVATRFDIWDREDEWQNIKSIIEKIGTPGISLMHSIRKRDERQDPKSLIKKIKSKNPILRNKAIRFMRLARVKNEHRPDSMSREEFIFEMSKEYLKQYSYFSVESHIYFYLYLRSHPKHIESFELLIQRPKFQKTFSEMLQYFKDAPPESLHQLPQFYQDLLKQDKEQKKAA